MTTKNAINLNALSVMGFSYYYFTKARFFVSPFGITKNRFCPVHN